MQVMKSIHSRWLCIARLLSVSRKPRHLHDTRACQQRAHTIAACMHAPGTKQVGDAQIMDLPFLRTALSSACLARCKLEPLAAALPVAQLYARSCIQDSQPLS